MKQNTRNNTLLDTTAEEIQYDNALLKNNYCRIVDTLLHPATKGNRI